MARPLLVSFVGGHSGAWEITRLEAVTGPRLASASRLDVVTAGTTSPGTWCLRGVTSNERYVESAERARLVSRQEGLGRTGATAAALIPIRKSETWWEFTHDERRAIFEQRSAHIATGLEYLPLVARRLHHSRDLGEDFDFLTWFEYAPAGGDFFEELVGRLRETEEWSYVDREVDIRLAR